MRPTLMAIMLFGLFNCAWAADIWSDLWRNADQQGEVLLKQGNARAASTTYADPERRAYAELKSGDYAAAAHSYAPLSGNDARYNQGNALAFMGDLQGALKAYDAVLRNDPNHRDARHNRDLVANALKQQAAQPQKPQDSKKQDGKSNDDKQQGQTGADKNRAGPEQGKSGDQGKSGSAGKVEQKPGQGGQQSGDQGEQNNDGKSGAGAQNSVAAPPPAQPGTQGSQAQNSARQDAMASLGKGAVQPGKIGATGQTGALPVSEQQIAQDQWLRAIPDDPGGLLRRKFLIEHMMRQQKEQP